MNSMNGEDQLRELLALEAVGALSEAERAELDVAIEDRPDLRDELESLRAAALTMADAVREPPPPGVRGRVLDAITTVPQEPALSAPAPAASPVAPAPEPVAPVVPITAARRHRWRWGAAAVAAAAVAIGVMLVSPFAGDDAGDHIADVLDNPSRTIELTGELSGLRLVYSEAVGSTVLEGVGVTAPAGDEVLELWRVAGTVPEPVVREFRPEDDGSVAVLMEGLDPGDDVFAVTVEPVGGSDQPTSEPVAVTA
jgi:anti-sigma-K factor RskA